MVPLLVVLVFMAEVAWGQGTGLHAPTTWQLIFLVAGAGALFWRRRFPRTSAVAAMVCGAAFPAAAPHLIIPDVATMVALYTVARHTDRRTATILATVAAVLLTASSAIWLPDHFGDIHVVVPINYVAAAVAVGSSIRNQRAMLHEQRQRAVEAEQSREAEARRQVREERIRIARDLHDVVAHHITLVNAQAGVAHHLMRTDPDRAYQALAGIQETSRTALDELRATVGLLRSDDEPESRQPTPAFEQLDELVETFRQSGFDVQVSGAGAARPLVAAAGLAAYRIVQEALTNAGKHGVERRADLELSYLGDVLEIVVTNAARAGHRGPGTGHGMIGMRERAESAGGRFSAGLRSGEVFEVRATLPLEPQTRTPITHS
ncbi:sensor histidine kinase [Actinoplanes sp. L3-i22]|uniref:sensor histidine kinase n=1 Tax=Actinoplanes sp. L3-i22 TaxID=2836373 RepID=UPI001C791227|nr:histidine kinase [Actinoplanes sp. L3-i22]BCY08539.1 two-component sensor histidine kinase [Actinoplanes sp. L3-i22]